MSSPIAASLGIGFRFGATGLWMTGIVSAIGTYYLLNKYNYLNSQGQIENENSRVILPNNNRGNNQSQV